MQERGGLDDCGGEGHLLRRATSRRTVARKIGGEDRPALQHPLPRRRLGRRARRGPRLDAGGCALSDFCSRCRRGRTFRRACAPSPRGARRVSRRRPRRRRRGRSRAAELPRPRLALLLVAMPWIMPCAEKRLLRLRSRGVDDLGSQVVGDMAPVARFEEHDVGGRSQVAGGPAGRRVRARGPRSRLRRRGPPRARASSAWQARERTSGRLSVKALPGLKSVRGPRGRRRREARAPGGIGRPRNSALAGSRDARDGAGREIGRTPCGPRWPRGGRRSARRGRRRRRSRPTP